MFKQRPKREKEIEMKNEEVHLKQREKKVFRDPEVSKLATTI